MSTQLLGGNWNQLQGVLKQKYGQITDDDLKYVERKEQELLGRIQKKLGLTKDAMDLMIKEHSAIAKHKAKKSHKH